MAIILQTKIVVILFTFVLNCPNNKATNFASDNDLAQNRRKVINWTKDSLPGPRFTNGFSIAFQIRWKFRSTLISSLI